MLFFLITDVLWKKRIISECKFQTLRCYSGCVFHLLYVTKDWIKSTDVHLTEHLWSRWGLGIDFSAWAKNSLKDLWGKMHNNDSFPFSYLLRGDCTAGAVRNGLNEIHLKLERGKNTHTQRKNKKLRYGALSAINGFSTWTSVYGKHGCLVTVIFLLIWF